MRHLSRRLGVALAVTAAACATTSFASVPASASTADRTPATSTVAASPAKGSPDFSGIVALDNCSGSIVRWKSSKPSDKALMLTNGHCTKFYGAREVDVDKPLTRTVTLLNADGTDRGSVSTTTLLYGTMDRTDVSLYELAVTYAKLKSQYDVPALTISAKQAAAHDRIVIISGYWKKAYRCHLDGFVYQLREYVWTWDHSLRYNESGCHTIHGTSGSPILNPATRDVIGINNTGNDDGEECTLNNPCEVDKHGDISVHEGRAYGEQTWWFTTCLGADRQLHLAQKGCLLPRP